MMFECDLDLLGPAVAWAAAVTPAKPTQPVLGGIKITAKDGHVTVAGFDYETSARSSFRAAITTEGTVLIPGRYFAQVAAKLPKSQAVYCELDGEQLAVRCGKADFTVPTLPAGEYPTLPAMGAAAATVSAEEFGEIAKAVARAASRKSELPILNGILIIPGPDGFTLVATDRYRLAVGLCPAEMTDPSAAPAPFLAPVAPLLGFLKAAGGDGKITLALDTAGHGGVLGLSDGVRDMTMRGIGGEYVKWESFANLNPSCTAIVDTSQLTDAASRVDLASDDAAPVKLTFTGSDLTVSASRGDGAAATETIDGTGYNGEDGMQVFFNAAYLIEGLAGTRSKFARMAMQAPNKPVNIYPAAADEDPDSDAPADAAFRYTVVPIRQAGK